MRRLIVIAVLALFLVACQPSSKEVAIGTPFIGGSQGLAMGFQDFRAEVFDAGTDPFDVIVRLENKGEAVVGKNDVKVTLSGINPAEFDKTAEQLSLKAPDDIIEMRRDSEGSLIPGTPGFVEFVGLKFKKGLAGGSAPFTLRADACYTYRTKALSRVCVRDNILAPKSGGICEINEAKETFNSGAPVHVTNFRESARASDKIGFSFTIENVNTGKVFQRNAACDKNDRTKADKVYVAVNTGLSGLQCSGLETTATGAEGFVTLYGGTKIVSCTQDVDDGDYEQLVGVELVYDYEDTMQTTVTVKKSGS